MRDVRVALPATVGPIELNQSAQMCKSPCQYWSDHATYRGSSLCTPTNWSPVEWRVARGVRVSAGRTALCTGRAARKSTVCQVIVSDGLQPNTVRAPCWQRGHFIILILYNFETCAACSPFDCLIIDESPRVCLKPMHRKCMRRAASLSAERPKVNGTLWYVTVKHECAI